MNSEDIKNLNSILEGEYIAIKSFAALIMHADDVNAKNELKKIQETHKQHASQLSTKIQELGGNPHRGIGIDGMVSETISNIKHIGTTDNVSYLREALKEEHIGTKAVNEMLTSNTDFSSDQLLNEIISHHQTNINSLNNLINTYGNAQ
ncbi:MAG: DUF2383 domain-containing protein [Clostridium sp.]|uniref:DUF2383 domain-containing protein n=1 Tax=Clostridium sp. TaxID=1506 RepID=UPI003D6D2C68